MSNSMESGKIDMSDLKKCIESYPSLTYRFMAQRIEGAFQGTRLILGASPASWKGYDYNDVLFRAGSEPGTVISDWLSKGEVGLCEQKYPLPPFQTVANYERRPSHTSYGLFTILKPYTFYRIGFNNVFSSGVRLL